MGKIRVLARATLNGLAGWVVARGPPVAHPCSKMFEVISFYIIICLHIKVVEGPSTTLRKVASGFLTFTHVFLTTVVVPLALKTCQ